VQHPEDRVAPHPRIVPAQLARDSLDGERCAQRADDRRGRSCEVGDRERDRRREAQLLQPLAVAWRRSVDTALREEGDHPPVTTSTSSKTRSSMASVPRPAVSPVSPTPARGRARSLSSSRRAEAGTADSRGSCRASAQDRGRSRSWAGRPDRRRRSPSREVATAQRCDRRARERRRQRAEAGWRVDPRPVAHCGQQKARDHRRGVAEQHLVAVPADRPVVGAGHGQPPHPGEHPQRDQRDGPEAGEQEERPESQREDGVACRRRVARRRGSMG